MSTLCPAGVADLGFPAGTQCRPGEGAHLGDHLQHAQQPDWLVHITLGVNQTGAKLLGTTVKWFGTPGATVVFDDSRIDGPGRYTLVVWTVGQNGPGGYGAETTSFVIDP
jgi:hypothetical protein